MREILKHARVVPLAILFDNVADMKILVVCQFYYPEHFSITDVARGFVQAGHEVLVVTGRPNYGLGRVMEGYERVKDEVIDGVRVHRCYLYPRKKSRLSIIRNYLSFWMHSREYCRHLKEEFDVVYSMSLSPLISISGGTIYAKKHHVKHILHCLDLWPESPVVTHAILPGGPIYWILWVWSKIIYSRLNRILVSSPSFEGYFRHELHVLRVPIDYVPQPPMIGNATCPVVFDHKVNFVYAGNVGTLQLVEQLVEAVDLIKDQIDVCLSIIGMGARVKAVQDLIAAKGLEEQVRFFGVRSRDETANFYVNATGIVVTLDDTGYVGKTIPGKLNGALYYGRPILACLGGDGKKVVEAAGGAVLAASKKPEDLAKAMLELGRKSEEEIKEMGEKNRRYFDENFDSKKVVDEVLKRLV